MNTLVTATQAGSTRMIQSTKETANSRTSPSRYPRSVNQRGNVPLRIPTHQACPHHPEQLGKILQRTQLRMGALWHLDLTPGTDVVFDELAVNYQGPVAISQDLTVFNVTEEDVVVRQASVSDAAPPVHGAPASSPGLDPRPVPPAWWADALLEV